MRLSRTYNYLFSRRCTPCSTPWSRWASASGLDARLQFRRGRGLSGLLGRSWGGGEQAIRAITSGEGLGVLGATGAMLIRVSVECVKLLAAGFLYSYLWTAATAIYLLLRRNVDAREMDEVFLDDDAPVLPLPTLKTDDSGVPEVVDEPEGGSETESKSS